MAIKENQVVSMLYEARDLATKDIVDSNMNGQPITFIVGKGQIIPGLEKAIKDMSMGESKDIIVSAKDAYGEYDEEAIQEVPKEQFAGIDLEVGMTLYGTAEDGSTVAVVVKEIKEDSVIIDFNHPLAGKDLLFSIHITMVRDATHEEILSGVPFENQQASSCSSGSCGCGPAFDDGHDPFNGGSCSSGGCGCGC
jgi:FKBP-type peptidyl-prolyl cis-trans isomerase SlyD